MDIVAFLPEYVKLGLMLIGSLVVLAQIIVPLTKTTKDDEALEWVLSKIPGNLLKLLLKFAVIQKK